MGYTARNSGGCLRLAEAADNKAVKHGRTSRQNLNVAWMELCAVGAVSFLLLYERLITVPEALAVLVGFNLFLVLIMLFARKFLIKRN